MLSLQFRSGLVNPNAANAVGWGAGKEAVHLPTVSPGYKVILPRVPPHFRQPFWPQKRGKKEVLDLELLWILGCNRD